MTQDLTEVLPDQFIQLCCRDVAGRTFLITAGDYRMRLAATGVVHIPVSGISTPGTRQPAESATDQGPQQILLRAVVAARKLLIVR